MVRLEGRWSRMTRAALVLVQVFLLLFSAAGQAVVLAADPVPSDAPASVEPSPDPSPSEAPASEPAPTDAPAPNPTQAPDPTAAPARHPSIASDLPDYAPGSLVTLTGSGWEPGEVVHLYVNDDFGSSWNRNVDVTADAGGQIGDQFNLPNWFVALYSVVATGPVSGQATTTFTDADNTNTTVTSSLNPSTPGAPVTFTATVKLDNNVPVTVGQVKFGTTGNNCTGGFTQLQGPQTVNGSGQVTFTTSALPAGATVLRACYIGTGGGGTQDSFGTVSQQVNAAIAATTLTVAPASGTYAGTTNLSATLTVTSGGAAVSGATISFTLDGTAVGSGTTNASGVAALSGVSLGTIGAGSYPTGVAASFAGNATRAASSGSAALTVAKAASVTTVSCTPSVTYTGSALEPCSASVSGAGGLNQALTTVTYGNNTNVGTATASASYAGDANHTGSSGSDTFTIGKSSSTTVVSCPAGPYTYTGSAQTPCSVSVTGEGGLNITPDPHYLNNTNAGSATASYTFAGDDNHSGSDDSDSFTIGKASSTTTVTCLDGPFVYDGNAIEPCTAKVTGAGGLEETVTVGYLNNINAGTASASASYAGDTNHHGSSDNDTFTIDMASSTTAVTCPAGPHTYSGLAQTPCSVSVTGAGGLDLEPDAAYANNVNAGTASASYTFTGDANHTGSSGSDTFAIGKATLAVDAVGASKTFAQDDPSFGWTYSGFVIASENAGNTGITGDADCAREAGESVLGSPYAITCVPGTSPDGLRAPNYSFVTGTSADFTINPADADCDVAGFSGTFDGDPHGATGTCTGVLGEDLTGDLDFGDQFTNVPGGTAHWSFSNENYNPQSGAVDIEIAKAPSTTTVTCAPGPHVYAGLPLEPCSATVIGAGGLTQTLTVAYANNISAGTATASATFAGDANHTSSQNSKTFTIDKASSATAVTCPTNVTYTGSALTPCTAKATGVGGLNQVLLLTYTDNTDAGTANASASYGGDANHTGSSDSEDFTIDKAASVTTVTCPASVTFTGSALTPCTAKATGVGGLDQSLTVSYSDNTNAGTATASASYGGDANHTNSSNSTTFAIGKASSSVALECPAGVTYTGAAQTPCSATVTGVGGLNQSLTVVYGNNVLGTATATATYGGDANHTGSSANTTFLISYLWDGYLQPINDTAHQIGAAQSKFKLGQTIPAKFVIKNAAGQIVQQASVPTFTRSDKLGVCDATVTAETDVSLPPDSGSVYAWDGSQYHFNWSTKGLQAGEYRIYANLLDGTKRYVDICLTK